MTMVMLKEPADVKSVAGIAAVSWVLLTNVVVLLEPLNLTTEVGTKLVPFTVSVKADSPTILLDGEILVVVGMGLLATTKVAVLVAVPAWQPTPLPANTVNKVEPVGVAAVVVIVSVEVAFPPVLVIEVGLNEAVAPVGNGVVTLNGEVQELLLPLKFTVTV